MDAAGSARLTESIAPSRAVTATLSRDEIVDAMGAGELPELHLEVEQRGAGHDERGSIAITWSREQLERILAGAKGDEIVLTFDRDDLAYALADVEAHGLRERALVFAVVVTGAIGTSAGVATAMPAADAGVGTGAGAAGVALTDVSSGGGYTAALQEPATAPALTDASSGAGYAAAAAIESGRSVVVDGCVVGRRVRGGCGDRVGRSVVVDGCVVGRRVRGGCGDRVGRSVVVDGCVVGRRVRGGCGDRVGRSVVVDGCVVGRRVRGGCGDRVRRRFHADGRLVGAAVTRRRLLRKTRPPRRCSPTPRRAAAIRRRRLRTTAPSSTSEARIRRMLRFSAASRSRSRRRGSPLAGRATLGPPDPSCGGPADRSGLRGDAPRGAALSPDVAPPKAGLTRSEAQPAPPPRPSSGRGRTRYRGKTRCRSPQPPEPSGKSHRKARSTRAPRADGARAEEGGGLDARADAERRACAEGLPFG